MTAEGLPCRECVRLRPNSEVSSVIDMTIVNREELKQYDSMECHITLYPYNRKIRAKNFTFSPFEEYVKDISSHQRSAYVEISEQFNNIFGLLLGIGIIVTFYAFKPVELFSIESVVSVFGAYIIGRDLWKDIEKILINLSKKWRLRYTENYYQYRLEKSTTLTKYTHFAKKHRHGFVPLLPEKMDFIEQSNSQTIRLFVDLVDIKKEKDESFHILSIHIDPPLRSEFNVGGYMLGVKLSLNRKVFGVLMCDEYFQSIHRTSVGCLDEENNWIDKGIFFRKTLVFGRIKYFSSKEILSGEKLFDLNGIPQF